jgi:tRNA modification GTPase
VICSLINDYGLNEIKTALIDKLRITDASDHHASISARHYFKLSCANDEVEGAISVLKEKGEEGLALGADHLRIALEHIGEIIGRVYSDDLLNTIFSKFCVGK